MAKAKMEVLYLGNYIKPAKTVEKGFGYKYSDETILDAVQDYAMSGLSSSYEEAARDAEIDSNRHTRGTAVWKIEVTYIGETITRIKGREITKESK